MYMLKLFLFYRVDQLDQEFRRKLQIRARCGNWTMQLTGTASYSRHLYLSSTKTPDEALLYLTVCLPTSLCDDDGPGESLLSLVAPGRSAE